MTARCIHAIHNIARACLLATLTASAGACIVLEPNGISNDPGQVAQADTPCSMVLVSASFGGYCGNLSVANNGKEPISGWQVSFDLPAGDSLISSWNGKFTTAGSHVVVTSLVPNTPMAPGTTLQLGYCSSAEAEDVSTTTGSCNGVQDPNTDTAPAISLNSPLNTNFTTLDENVFQKALANDGYATLCTGTDSNVITTSADGLDLGACGGVQWLAPILDGVISMRMRAATGAGVVTQLMSSVGLPSGIQGVAMAVSGTSPNTVALTVWRDGVATVQTADLGFDATQATHEYRVQWLDGGIVWSVDGDSVGTSTVVPQAAPEYLNVSVWTSDGSPSWTGTANPAETGTPAEISALIFAPVLAIQ